MHPVSPEAVMDCQPTEQPAYPPTTTTLLVDYNNEEETEEDEKFSSRLTRETRGQKEWTRKCISNFSLYANLVGNRVEDPYEEAAAIEQGEFKPKLSKSAKKRLRRQNKKRMNDALKLRGAQMKKISLAVTRKRTKKDINKMINKLSNLPL